FRMRGAAADPACTVDPRERARRSRRDRWRMELGRQRFRRLTAVLVTLPLLLAGLAVCLVLLQVAPAPPLALVLFWCGLVLMPALASLLVAVRAHRRIWHLEERLLDDRPVRAPVTYQARRGLHLWRHLPPPLRRILLVLQLVLVLAAWAVLVVYGWDMRGGDVFGIAILGGCLVVPSLIILLGCWSSSARARA
ncbi:MAG: hypothetical protein ACOCXA_06550, partial [Planctomycetota bacterium]